MKFVYEYNIDTEIRRALFVLEKVKSGFYQENNFLVLPYLIKGEVSTIYLPKLQRRLLEGLFNHVGSQLNRYTTSKYTFKSKFDERAELEDEIRKLMLSDEELTKVKSDWDKVQDKFIKILETIFNLDEYQINIRPTRLGSMSSNLDVDKKNHIFTVYYRVDTDISHLAEMILATLYENLGVDGTKDMWQKKEWSVDFMFKNSRLVNIFPNYYATLDIINKVHTDNKILQDSWAYYEYLGYPMVNSLTFRGENLLVNGEFKDISNYPSGSQSLLKLFVPSKNEVLTAEQVGACLWGEQAHVKFSLWAISKQIEGLRDMLAQLGVNPNILETHRKKGYLLRA